MPLTVGQLRIPSGGVIDAEDVSAAGTLLEFTTTTPGEDFSFGSTGGFMPKAPGADGTVLGSTGAGSTWTVLVRSRVAVTGSVTATPTALHGVTTTAAVTITLPTAPQDGVVVIVKDESGDRTNPITIARGGTDTMEDGTTSMTITTAYGGVNLYYGGTKWFTR